MKVYSLSVVSNIQLRVINFNLKSTDCSQTGKPKDFDGVELGEKTKGKYEEAEWENQCQYFEVHKLITKVNIPYLLYKWETALLLSEGDFNCTKDKTHV